jgi:hypothetical protein
MSGRKLPLILSLAFLLPAVAAASGPQKDKTIPPSIGDLNNAQLIEVRDTNGNVLLHGTFKTSENKSNETERKAELASPSGQAAKGEAEIEIERDKDGLITKDEIDVDVEKLPAMVNCLLVLDGQTIGEFVTTKKGKGEITLTRKSATGR